MRVPLTFFEVLKRREPEFFRMLEKAYALNRSTFPRATAQGVMWDGSDIEWYLGRGFANAVAKELNDKSRFYKQSRRTDPNMVSKRIAAEYSDDLLVAYGNYLHSGKKHFYFTDDLIERLLAQSAARVTSTPFDTLLVTTSHPEVARRALALVEPKHRLSHEKDLTTGIVFGRIGVELFGTYFSYNHAFGGETWGLVHLGTTDGIAPNGDPDKYPINTWNEKFAKQHQQEARTAVRHIFLNCLGYLTSDEADLTSIGNPAEVFNLELKTMSRLKRQYEIKKFGPASTEPTIVAGMKG